MANKIDWDAVIEETGKELSKEALETIEKNKDFLKDIGKQTMLSILHNFTAGNKEELSAEVMFVIQQQLSNEYFLNIRKDMVSYAKKWECPINIYN